jgi:non-ribosomal peptide synthetase component F
MTWERCTDPEPPEVLIGLPIDDTVVVLLDGGLRPVPIGVPAEICFGGAIAAGYQARDDLTAAKFIPIPPPLEDALRADSRCPPCPVLYRSGDLAMRLPSGNLRFLGRVDRQVRTLPTCLPLRLTRAKLAPGHRAAC